jgi:hypothetical protein
MPWGMVHTACRREADAFRKRKGHIMTDAKRYGCYDKIIGNRRYYLSVRGSTLVTTTQFLDERTEHGWVREEHHTMDYGTEARALDAMVDHADGDGWRHSDDWPREVITAW